MTDPAVLGAITDSSAKFQTLGGGYGYDEYIVTILPMPPPLTAGAGGSEVL